MADNTSNIVDLVNKRLSQFEGTPFDEPQSDYNTEDTKPWYDGWGLGGTKFNGIILLIILAVAIYIAYATRKLAQIRC